MSTLLAAFVLSLSLVSKVVSQTSGFDPITAPAYDEAIPVGTTYTIKWQPNSTSGTVSITLLGGSSSSSLNSLGTIAAGVQNGNGKYDWSVDSSLGTVELYGLMIALDSDPATFQYSFPFKIVKLLGTETYSTTVATSGASLSTGSSSIGAVPTSSTKDVVSSTSGVSSATSTNPPSGNDGPANGASLGTAAIAGITAAAVACIVIIASLLGLALYYRRKARARKSGGDMAHPNPELDGTTSLGTAQQHAALKSAGQYELDCESAEKLYEMEGKSVPAEIEGKSIPVEIYSLEEKSIPGEVFGLQGKSI